MNSSSAPRRRSVLRSLAVGVALVVAAAPAAEAAASGAADPGPEAVALTIVHIGRNGAPTDTYETRVAGVSGPGAEQNVSPYDASGTTTVRLPRGRYLLDSQVYGSDAMDWLVQPRLDLTRDTTVTVDARTTVPVDVRPPDGAAEFLHSAMFVEVAHGGATRQAYLLSNRPGLRTAHLGPDAEAGSVRQWYDGYWTAGAVSYGLGYTFSGRRALTGLTRHPAARDLAALQVRAAARSGAGGSAEVDVTAAPGPTLGIIRTVPAAGTATFLVTPDRGTWDVSYAAPTAPGTRPNRYSVSGAALRAGTTTVHTFDNAVLGPHLAGPDGATRDGTRLAVDLPLLADGDGHRPSLPPFDSATTTLHRNGAPLGTATGAPGRAEFTVPPGRAAYRLTSTVERGGAPGTATRVSASWTFHSQAAGGPARLPLSVVRFSPALDLDGTVAAGAPLRVPVTVLGAGSDGRTRSLTVAVSFDGGAAWSPLPVERGAVTVRHPRSAGGVSLRAELTDTDGNTLAQTIVDAYRTR
ncbi:serine protease [Kitasatospora sp. NPDC054939]